MPRNMFADQATGNTVHIVCSEEEKYSNIQARLGQRCGNLRRTNRGGVSRRRKAAPRGRCDWREGPCRLQSHRPRPQATRGDSPARRRDHPAPADAGSLREKTKRATG